jgi:hypothetical protein
MTAASDLARYGVSVRIVDKAPHFNVSTATSERRSPHPRKTVESRKSAKMEQRGAFSEEPERTTRYRETRKASASFAIE